MIVFLVQYDEENSSLLYNILKNECESLFIFLRPVKYALYLQLHTFTAYASMLCEIQGLCGYFHIERELVSIATVFCMSGFNFDAIWTLVSIVNSACLILETYIGIYLQCYVRFLPI